MKNKGTVMPVEIRNSTFASSACLVDRGSRKEIKEDRRQLFSPFTA